MNPVERFCADLLARQERRNRFYWSNQSPTPAEREKRILEALFPHERPRVSPTSGGEE